MLFELAADLVDGVVRLIAGVGHLAAGMVLLGVRLGVLDHLVDLILGEGGPSGDRDLLGLAGAQVLGGDRDDSVGVDVEAHLDLGDAPGGGGDPGQVEAAERRVAVGHFRLALQDVDLHLGLIVRRSGEDLRPASGDRGVALDHLGEHPTHGLDAQRQRGDVEQEDVLDVAAQHPGLDGGAGGYHLVGVDALMRFLAAGERLDQVLNGGHPGGSADEDDVVDGGHRDARILDRLLHRSAGRLDQILGHLVELGAGQGALHVQRPLGGGGDERQVDVGRGHLGELDLGLLGGLLEPLQRHRVLGEVDALGVLEPLHQPVDDALIPVVPAEVGVARGGLDLEDPLADLEHRHVEGPAAEVVDEDRLVVALLVEAVGQGGRGGLVDDAQHLETGDLAGLLGGLALGVAEVGGHGDHRLGDRASQVGLGIPLQLHEDAGADLLGAVVLAVDVHLPVFAHMALDGTDGAAGIGDRLTLGDLADEDLSALGEGDHRRRGALPLGVGDHRGLAALIDGHHAVGGAEVDSDCSRHGYSSSSSVTGVLSVRHQRT